MLWLLLAYSLIHTFVFTAYPNLAAANSISLEIQSLQWIIPPIILLLFLYYYTNSNKAPRITNKAWNVFGLSVFVLCVILQITGAPGYWWSWSTLALLTLVALNVTDLTKDKIGSFNSVILGLLVVFSSIATFEIIYHTGALIYHDFFGCGVTNYIVTIFQQISWILPTILALIFLKKKGYGWLVHFNLPVAMYIFIAAICTVVWFAKGMAIPLNWNNGVSSLNINADKAMIIVSRAVQTSVVMCFVFMFKNFRRDSA